MSLSNLFWVFLVLIALQLFPQPKRTVPSVQYIPLPHRGGSAGRGA